MVAAVYGVDTIVLESHAIKLRHEYTNTLWQLQNLMSSYDGEYGDYSLLICSAV
jgi:hypothetical protein